MALDRAVRNGEKKLRCICGLLFRFKFMQEKMFHIGYVLAETVIFRVFNGQDTEQFPLQFGNQILIFDDISLSGRFK